MLPRNTTSALSATTLFRWISDSASVKLIRCCLSSLVPAHPTIRCLTFLRLQTQRTLYNIALIWRAEIVRPWLTNCLKTDESL